MRSRAGSGARTRADLCTGVPRRDHGFGLAELLVTMALTSLLLVALGTVFLSDIRTTSRITAKVQTTADVRLAIDTAGRRLRVATSGPATNDPVFVATSPRSVTFYASLEKANTNANTSPDPSRVTYEVVAVPAREGECFRETVVPPSVTGTAVTYQSSTAKTIDLACGAIAPSGAPIFTYYASGAGTAVAADPAEVRSVGVDLAVAAVSGGQSATTSASLRVGLPNTTFVKETS